MRRSLGVLAVASMVVVAATAAARAQAESNGGKLSVVTSFSILRDLAANVGGDSVDVTALVGPGGDVHVYAPTPADARIVGAARLIVVNGLGFEGWMDRLVRASATQAPIIVATDGVVPRQAAKPGNFEMATAGVDPHAWQSPHNAEIYVANIRDGLIRADPPGRRTYEANAAAYIAELARLDTDIRRAVAAIPPTRRKVITTHDAFGYLAADYGIAFTAVQGISSETEASARDVAGIIRTIREQNIPALFFENAVDPRLVRLVAAETGARIGGTLFSDTLTTAAGPAATYVDMMRHNIRAIVDALN